MPPTFRQGAQRVARESHREVYISEARKRACPPPADEMYREGETRKRACPPGRRSRDTQARLPSRLRQTRQRPSGTSRLGQARRPHRLWRLSESPRRVGRPADPDGPHARTQATPRALHVSREGIPSLWLASIAARPHPQVATQRSATTLPRVWRAGVVRQSASGRLAPNRDQPPRPCAAWLGGRQGETP